MTAVVAYGCVRLQDGEGWDKVVEQGDTLRKADPENRFFDVFCVCTQVEKASRLAARIRAEFEIPEPMTISVVAIQDHDQIITTLGQQS
jgi:hypothetical protein